jgi:hypothetical protein
LASPNLLRPRILLGQIALMRQTSASEIAMKKTLIAAAFALTTAVASLAIQSPASASPTGPNAALGGQAAGGLISTVASPTAQRHPTTPPPDQQEQAYPVYHDSPTASYFSTPTKAMPCHFTEAFVEGRARQVEVCN